MKKAIIAFGLFFLILLPITGCSGSQSGSRANQSTKSVEDIRKMAYQSLSEVEKKTVTNWETAEVKEYKADEEHYVISDDKVETNLKGKDTYMVTFHISNEGLLGPITIYMDKNSYAILGSDFRY